MKKIIVVFLAIFLLAGLSVTAFAVENPYDSSFVPEIPDWITIYNYGNSIQYHGKNELESGMSREVFSDFFATTGPYVVLLSQGVYNKYKEDNDIDYDREYQIYYLKLKNQNSSSEFEFGSFSHHGGPHHSELMTTGNTMLFRPLFNEFQCIKASYDRERDALIWDASPVTISHTAIPFTYVLGAGDPVNTTIFSSPLSGEHDLYPYKDCIGGLTMEISTDYNYAADSPNAEDYCERDYDWWVGIDGENQPPIKPPYNPDDDLNKDMDGDGRPDINIDSDGDGRADVNVDTDGDGKPDINIDTDGDKKPDVNIDTNGDGKPDINIDTDGDGKPDINIDTNGDKKPDVNVDTNGDRKPDVNIDTNGDGKPDINIDTDGDKKPDVNIDTNGDRKPDINIDTNGDGKPDTNIDTDGDGKPDLNVKPGHGSGSSGSDVPDSWWEDNSGEDLTYNAWEFFNPFKFMYEPFEWDNSFDPVASYQLPTMPDFPGCGIPDVSIKDPFDIPNDIHFKDYVIEFGGK